MDHLCWHCWVCAWQVIWIIILCILISQSWFLSTSWANLHLLVVPSLSYRRHLSLRSITVPHSVMKLAPRIVDVSNWDLKNTSQTPLYWCVFQRGPVSNVDIKTAFWAGISSIFNLYVRPTCHIISSDKTEIWVPLSKMLYTSFLKLTFAYGQFCKLESSI